MDAVKPKDHTDWNAPLTDAREVKKPAKVDSRATHATSQPPSLESTASERKQVAKFATYEITKRTLEKHPEQADQFIQKRVNGQSAVDREIVALDVVRRGNMGLRKYADAERVLRDLKPFTPEQRGDILAIMKVGVSFENAAKDVRADLAKSATQGERSRVPTVADLKRQALANLEQHAAKVKTLGTNVTRLSHAIGKLTRSAEFTAGIGSAVGLVGGSAVAVGEAAATGSSKPITKTLDRADAAGALMTGELTRRIAEADKTTLAYFNAADAYATAKNKYAAAIRNGDHEAVTKHAGEMDAAIGELQKQASSLAQQAKSIASWNKRFEHALTETVIAAVSTAAGAGIEFSHLAHPVDSVAAEIVKDGLRERVIQAGFEHLQGSKH